MAIIIRTNNDIEELNNSGFPITLEQIQTAIGGYIELAPFYKTSIVEIKNKKYNNAYCNEDGISKQLKINLKASKLLGFEILGDVVFTNLHYSEDDETKQDY